MKKLLLFFLLLLPGIFGIAQDSYTIGFLPQLNTSFSLGDDWKLNAKLESRQFLFNGLFSQPVKPSLTYERSDLELVATKSLNSLRSVGGGYLLRQEGKKFIHRTIQQYAITQRYTSFRLAHRFRADQTFERNEAAIFRLRYRASLERALNGFAIDPKEFYLKINNEYLGWTQKHTSDLEIRALVALGYYFSDKKKLETGIDYRAEEIFSDETSHLFWLNVAFHLSF